MGALANFLQESRTLSCSIPNQSTDCSGVSQSVDLGRSINPNTTQQRTTKICEWWFASAVSREDVLRRGRGDLHQQGDADRDAGYSWGTGAIEDKGDRCLDSSYSLGSVKAGIG